MYSASGIVRDVLECFLAKLLVWFSRLELDFRPTTTMSGVGGGVSWTSTIVGLVDTHLQCVEFGCLQTNTHTLSFILDDGSRGALKSQMVWHFTSSKIPPSASFLASLAWYSTRESNIFAMIQFISFFVLTRPISLCKGKQLLDPFRFSLASDSGSIMKSAKRRNKLTTNFCNRNGSAERPQLMPIPEK